MNKPLRLLVCLLTVSGMLSLWLNNAGSTSHHLAAEACDGCHLTSGVVDPRTAYQLIGSQEELCSQCHSRSTMASHPTGFTPSFQPPAMYPLDWKGELTCSTCHDPHGSRVGLMRNDLAGRDYCMSCHEPGFFDNMMDQISTGHLTSGVPPLGFTGTIDDFSLECLGCHAEEDGSLDVNLSASGVVLHNSSKGNHPIGRVYEDATLKGGFHPTISLPSHISLPDGMVSCISCHEGYTAEHGKLVESNNGSQLCFRCHNI